jgi:hypothetical protein
MTLPVGGLVVQRFEALSGDDKRELQNDLRSPEISALHAFGPADVLLNDVSLRFETILESFLAKVAGFLAIPEPHSKCNAWPVTSLLAPPPDF